MASLLSNVTTAALPICVRGNDWPWGANVFGDGFIIEETYDGPVYYRSKHLELNEDTFVFDVSPTGDDSRGQVLMRVPQNAIAEPTVGQEFWSTLDGSFGTLRETQDGPPLALTLIADLPLDTPEQTRLSELLDAPVRSQLRCDYAQRGDATLELWDLLFDGATLQSDTRTQIALGDRRYSAWMSSAAWPNQHASMRLEMHAHSQTN